MVLKEKVRGNIECDHINIASEGDLKGNIKFKFNNGGNFIGDVFADSLAIELLNIVLKVTFTIIT